jgi:hypothetical protein
MRVTRLHDGDAKAPDTEVGRRKAARYKFWSQIKTEEEREMEKDNAVRNQKAFIRMAAILEFQRYYDTVVQELREARSAITTPNVTDMRTRLAVRKESLERAIQTLELPITTVRV